MDETKLKDVALINSNSISKNFNFDEIEYIDISSVGTGTLIGTQKILLKEAPSRAKRLVNAGDTILSTVRPNRRSFLYFKNSKPNLVASTGFAVLTPTKKIDSRYLYYVINDQKISDYLTNSAKGAAYPAVDTEIVGNITFNLPPLLTQQKIASMLSAYDDLIENNTRRIKILEEMAQTIYKEWFVNFRLPGHEKIKFIDSPLGKIPEGWEVKKLESFCSKLTDGTHDTPKPKSEGFPLITGKQMKNGFINFDECYKISEEDHLEVMKRSKPEKGDIIYSNIGTLGSPHYVLENFEFSIKNVALFKPLNKFYSIYLYLYLSSPITLEILSKKASGTSQKFFSLVFLRSIDCVNPSKNILEQLFLIISPMLRERHLLNIKNQKLYRSRDLLLPKLMSGEVAVSAEAEPR